MKGTKEYSLDIENVKYLIGDNIKIKFEIMNILRTVFNKITESEYSLENREKCAILFDDNPISNKLWNYFEITPFFDIEIDMKLGTKSMFSKYLNTYVDSLIQNETYTTLSILINSLNEDFFSRETSFKINNKDIGIKLANISHQVLLKEALVSIISEEFSCNSADFSTEELILIQLSLFERIAKHNKEQYFLAYCYIPFFTKQIIEKLSNINIKNAFILVNNLDSPLNNISNVAIYSKRCIDFANEDQIDELLMDLPLYVEKNILLNRISSLLSDKKCADDNRLAIELLPWKI